MEWLYEKSYKITPYIWWPLTAFIVIEGYSSFTDLVEELPWVIGFIVPLIYTYASFVMLLRFSDKKSKLRSEQIVYEPSKEADSIINSIIEDESRSFTEPEERDKYISEKIDKALIAQNSMTKIQKPINIHK